MGALLLIGATLTRLVFPVLVLLLATYLLFAQALGQVSIDGFVGLSLVALAGPGIGLIAGALLDRALGAKHSLKLLAPILAAVGFYAVLNSNIIPDVLVAMRQAPHSGLGVVPLALIVGRIFYCASLIALVCLLINLTIELPARWLESKVVDREMLPWEALRPILIVLVLSLAVNQIVDLASAELRPRIFWHP